MPLSLWIASVPLFVMERFRSGYKTPFALLSVIPKESRHLCVSLLWRSASIVFVLLCLVHTLHAQRPKEDALSQAEIEKLRDTNRLPSDRVEVFIKFLDERTDTIRSLVAKPRRPGREEDIHDAMEQFISIADSLEDNLNEYGPRHRDIRKSLPKLLRAIDRWSSIIKSPTDDDAYNVSRKLSLESIRDLREDTERLIEDQKTWFAAHPPQKDAEGNLVEQ